MEISNEGGKTIKTVTLDCEMPADGMFEDSTRIVSGGLTVTITSD